LISLKFCTPTYFDHVTQMYYTGPEPRAPKGAVLPGSCLLPPNPSAPAGFGAAV